MKEDITIELIRKELKEYLDQEGNDIPHDVKEYIILKKRYINKIHENPDDPFDFEFVEGIDFWENQYITDEELQRMRELEQESNDVIEYIKSNDYRRELIYWRLNENPTSPFYLEYPMISRFGPELMEKDRNLYEALRDVREFNICWFFFLCGKINKELLWEYEKKENFKANKVYSNAEYILEKINYGKDLNINIDYFFSRECNKDKFWNYLYSFYAGQLDGDLQTLKKNYEIRVLRYIYRHNSAHKYREDENSVMGALESGYGERYGY